MLLTFAPEDETEFLEVKRVLLDELHTELAASDALNADQAAERVEGAGVFVEWRFNDSNGDLSTFTVADLDEYLLGWVPRTFSAPPGSAHGICMAVADFVVQMASRHRLTDASDGIDQLISRTYQLVDDVEAAMTDPSNFGMAKSLFAVPLAYADGNALPDIAALVAGGADPSSPEMRALMQQRIDAFNDLACEERKAITDRQMEGVSAARIRPVKLPFTYVPPTDADVDTSARESKLVAMVDALRDDVGTAGIEVNQGGNLRPADAEQLVELLQIGDEWEHDSPPEDETGSPRSSSKVRWLSFVYDVAVEAGALNQLDTKVTLAPEWLELPIVERATEIIQAALDIGLVSSAVYWEHDRVITRTLEGGIPHWLARAFPEGSCSPLEGFVDQAVTVVNLHLSERPGLLADDERFRRVVAGWMYRVFDALETAGIIRWSDREANDGEPGRFGNGSSFEMTPLGRRATVDWILDAGYAFPILENVSEMTVADVVAAGAASTIGLDTAVNRWMPQASVTDKAGALGEHAMATDSAEERITVMAMLALLEPVDEVAPVVRQMLDSRCAGHAAMFLLERDVTTPDTIGSFLDLGPLVDLLSTLLDTPELAALLFAEVQNQADDDMIEEMVRHDQPETIEVLDVLGRHLDDKKMAKSARKAAMRHRSWIANLHR